MPLGLFAPMPLRLGGSAEEGWTAAQHARVCADVVALKRSMPLCVITYTLDSGLGITVHDYYGMNGAGAAYQPDVLSVGGPGISGFSWTVRSFEDPYEVAHPINAQHGKVTCHGTVSLRGRVLVVPNGVEVYTFNSAGAGTDCKVTVVLW